MGQQQLLIVILVTIVVGISSVVALFNFNEAFEQAAIDRVQQDLVTIGAAAQVFYSKPAMYGGGSRSFDGSSSSASPVTFHDIAFGGIVSVVEGNLAENELATYELKSPEADHFVIEAVAKNTGETIVRARICRGEVKLGQAGEEVDPPECEE